MGNKIRYEDLSSDRLEVPEKPLEDATIIIDVAGPKKTEEKVISLSLDVHGLIKLAFKTGGTLPAILRGRFTTVRDVKTALTAYTQREAKHFDLDESVTRGDSLRVSEASVRFEDVLDPALTDK